MSNREFKQFPFGFLNVAQDPTNIEETESSDVRNVDPDALALGTLKYLDYGSIPTSTRDYLETTMNGRRFYLGSEEDYTTYDGTNGVLSYQTFNKEVDALDTDGAICFKIRFNSTSDGFVFGNYFDATDQTTERFYIAIASGDLVMASFFGSPATWQVRTIISGIATSQWYDVVIHDRFSSGATDTIFYVDGSFVSSNRVSHTSSDAGGQQFYLGSWTYSSSGPYGSVGASFDLGNFYWHFGKVDSPNEWDGTIDSIGIVSGSAILSMKEGNPLLNKQNVIFYRWNSSVPFPTGVFNQAKASGKLISELDSDQRETQAASYRTHGSNSVPESRILTSSVTGSSDADMVFGSNVFIGFWISPNFYASSANFSVLTFGDYTTGYEHFEVFISSNLKTLSIIASDSVTGSTATVDLDPDDGSTNSEEIVHNFDRIVGAYVSFTLTTDTVGNTTTYWLRAYVDGNLAFEFENDNAWTLLNTSAQYTFASDNASSFGAPPYGYSFIMRDVIFGNLDSKNTDITDWDGSKKSLEGKVNILFSAADGDVANNDQGYNLTLFTAGGYPSQIIEQVTDLGVPVDEVNDNKHPRTPEFQKVLPIEKKTNLVFEQSDLSGVSPSVTLSVIPGKVYTGPELATIRVKDLAYAKYNFSSSDIRFIARVNYDGSDRYTELTGTGDHPENIYLSYNLMLTLDTSGTAAPGSTTIFFAGPATLFARSSELLDGKYSYRAIGVRYKDTNPRTEILSLPSKAITTELNNIDAGGERKGNDVPVVNIPAASPGYPNFIDRVDLYRKDPDADQYVKVFEHKNDSVTTFVDKTPLTELPRIEFLPNEGVEGFEKINEAIGNDSGTFSKIFNKDNRVFVVPTDRQDLILYSDESAWWQWRRENSFRFNGNIVEISLVRDTTVLTGQQTLVVSTTTGIYHMIGNGSEDTPYEVIPVIGGDGFTDLEVMASSQINANGDVFLMTKSTDGGYETGAYGQKIYQYDLQKLIEISGRVRESTALAGTGGLSYANLIAGDKYLIKKTDQDLGLVYHKDARGWLYFDTTESGWKWTSKHFTREQLGRGTPAFAKQFKIDYIGSVTVRFYIEQKDRGDVQTLEVPLSSVGFRTEYQNVMPSGMGRKWWLEIEGDSNSEVYGFWFVQ